MYQVTFRILILLSAVGLSSCSSDVGTELCSQLRSAGQDDKLVSVTKQELITFISNPSVLERFGTGGYLSAYTHPSIVGALKLDWRGLGLDPRFIFVSLHHPELSGEVKFSKDRIRFIGIGQQRNQLVFSVDSDASHRSMFPAAASGTQYETLREGVYLKCELPD